MYFKNRFWLVEETEGIFTKNVDYSPAELFYDGDKKKFQYYGKILKPMLKEKILISLRQDFLTLIPIKDDYTAGEAKILNFFGKFGNKDITVFDDKLFVLSKNSNLTLIKIRLLGKKVRVKVMKQFEIQVIDRGEMNDENSEAIEICNRGKYIMIHQADDYFKASSLIVFEIYQWNFVQKYVLDIGRFRINEFNSFKFVGWFGKNVCFSALPCSNKVIPLFTFCYDIKSKKIWEVTDLRALVNFSCVYKYSETTDGHFGGIDTRGNIFRIKYE